MSSSHAGLLAASRALRSLRLPALVEANLSLKLRARGFTEAQAVESLVLPTSPAAIALRTSPSSRATSA